jgi:hypothetical protein
MVKIKKEVIAVSIVAFIILGFYFFGEKSETCFSEIDSSHCDNLENSGNVLSCYKNLSFYKNEPCLCERLSKDSVANCYYEFAINARNSDVCSKKALQDYKTEGDYSGSDACYYGIVYEHANQYSHRLSFAEIVKICSKIDDSLLQIQCLKHQQFAREY